MRSTKSDLTDDLLAPSRIARQRPNFPCQSLPAELAERGVKISTANTGDHALIHQFLVKAGRSLSDAEFHAQLEDPYYEPVNRLVVRHGCEIVGHARLIPREMHFGSWQIPVTEVAELVTLPEYAVFKLPAFLLQEAQRRMLADASIAGLARTGTPHWFDAADWSVRGQHGYSIASARDLLSHLRELRSRNQPPLIPRGDRKSADPPLAVRLFRHVEQDALVRLYDASAHPSFGRFVRGDAYWRWLTSRRGFDRIYVSTRDGGGRSPAESTGGGRSPTEPHPVCGEDLRSVESAGSRAPRRSESGQRGGIEQWSTSVVGYAAVKDDRIVELMCERGEEAVAHELISRACYDAIERGFHDVRLDGPPDWPIHRLIRNAGGTYCQAERDNGDSLRLKLLDPFAFLRQLGPLLIERAGEAQISLPVELGLLMGNKRYLLSVSDRSVEIVANRLGRSYLELAPDLFPSLLWGAIRVGKALDDGCLTASTQLAARLADVLFPRLPLWYPPLDSLPG